MDSHLASGVMSRVGRQQPFPICQQDNCKRRLKVASTCHVLLPILPPPPISPLPISGKAMSILPIPSGLLPLFNFDSPLLLPRQQLLFMLSTVFAFTLLLLSLSFSSLFFDNEKCSTRFSLLIYVLARFSYTLALICCCCFVFFSLTEGVAPLIQFHLSWLHLQLFSMHRCAI